MSSAYNCVNTEITNVSGSPIYRLSIFGGRSLAVGESFTVKGDVWAWLAGKFPGIKGRRMIEKFADMVDIGGPLAITSVPSTCGDTYNSSSSTFVPA